MSDFSDTCAGQLHQAQVTGLSLWDLTVNLKSQAANLGVTFAGTPGLGVSPYSMPTDTETQYANNIFLAQAKYKKWNAAGRPSIP